MGILSGIANPTIADPIAAFNRGAQRGRDKETQRLVGEILGATTSGKLGALGKVNPTAAIKLAGSLKFEDDPKKQLNDFVGTVQLSTAVANSVGPKESLAILVEARKRLKGMVDRGMLSPGATTTLDGMIQKFNEDPQQGMEALNLMNDSLVEQGLAVAPGGGAKFSPKTEFLEDGTTLQTDNQGNILVNGKAVSGEERAAAVKKAAEEGIRIQKERGAGRTAASAAIKRSEKAFDSVEAIKANILNLDEGIKLLDEGAETGPVMSLLPSVRKASVELDNLQGRLGLDVLRTTTFGALSAAELNFALDTSLPQKLEPPALRAWMVRKKEAQLKLSSYLTDLAAFLGEEGNTTADFIQLQKLRQLERESAAAKLTPEQRKERIAVLKAKQQSPNQQ